MRIRTPFIVIGIGCAVVTLTAMVWSQGRGNPNDWPTAFGDAQHTSWVRNDINISVESMSRPGFALQWTSKLDFPARQAESLTSGVVTPSVNIFTPLSTIAGPGNMMFSVDNDTGNVFWTRRFEGAVPASTGACAGGISGAPTRVVNLVIPPGAPARGGGARGGRAYSSAVGEPGAGVPLPAAGARGGGGGGAAAAGRAGAAPAAPAQPAPGAPAPQGQAAGGQRGRVQGPPQPPSPFPTNAAAQGSGGIWAPSGTVYAVSGDGMFRRLGLVSGKDVQRPARFLPAGAKFSDLIAVGDMAYTSTSGSCGGAPRGIWAINISGDPASVVSWKTNGGDPIGSVAFSTTGTLFAAIGPGRLRAEGAPAGQAAQAGYANAIVALDPKTLAIKDWFSQPGVEFISAPVLFEDEGRNIVVVTTRDGSLLLLDAASLGGPNHSTPLVSMRSITDVALTAQQPAMWVERAAAEGSGTRWLLVPTTSAVVALKVVRQSGAYAIQPGWISEHVAAPLTPIVVNGVAFAVAGARNQPARLVALNATTGKTMWQSERAMSRAVSGRSFWTGSGHMFVGTVDGTVHAFGFDMERGRPDQRP
jgi:hypothetical protein